MRIGDWLNRIYCEIWYHAEWFVKNKYVRRPFTYIMRDFVYARPYFGVPIILGLIAGLVILCIYHPVPGALVSIFYGMLQGHLWWGTHYKPGEQEEPEYLGVGIP